MRADGAAAIGFDIIFAERSMRQEISSDAIDRLKALARNSDLLEIRERLLQALESLAPEADDLLFVSSVEQAKNVFHSSVFFTDENDPQELRPDETGLRKITDALSSSGMDLPSKTGSNVFFNATVPFHELAKASRGIGHINFHPDKDGTCRRAFPLLWLKETGKAYPSLALIISAYIMNIPLDSLKVRDNTLTVGTAAVPLLPGGSMMIDFQGGRITEDKNGKEYYESSYRYIPYDQVIASRDMTRAGQEPLFPKGTFRDKIVLVTASAAGLSDLRSTPFSPVTPGIEIHANVIDSLLSGKFLRRIDRNVEYLYIFLLALVIAAAASLGSPYVGSSVSVVLTGTAIGIHWVLFGQGWILPIVFPAVAMTGTYLGVLLIRYVSEERQKRQIRSAFGHYLAPQVLEDVLKSPEKLRLGGERRYMTVMFTDLEGFTSLSEQLTPEEISIILNKYLGRITECIKAAKGTLDKFIGDAVMAEWNAPVEQPDHAAQACSSALMMMEELRTLGTEMGKDRKPLNARIGINTGWMVVGNMGSGEIFDYTVIGSDVNIAARLEPLNKDFGTNIIVSENVKDEAEKYSPGRFVFRLLAKVILKGRTGPLKVYELAGSAETINREKLNAIRIFESGMDAFLNSRFTEAKQSFQQALKKHTEDGPSKIYITLCELYENDPPPPGWDGPYVQTVK